MSISNLTALIIANRGDDIKTSAGFDKNTGKWLGWITLGVEERYRPLLNSEAIYESEQEAVDAMQKTVQEIRTSFNI